jgi:hypothetical protein
MAEILGPLTLQDKALPTGVDGARVAQWAMRDGVTFEQLIGQVSQALGTVNQMLVEKWGFLFNITEEIMMEYPNGGSVTAMAELTDEDKPVAIKGTTIGHMLPLKYYGNGIGGTHRELRDVRSAQIRAQITTLVNRGVWRFEQKLIDRFFDSDDEAIGSAGYSVPFVHSTTGNVDFQPPAYDGNAFATTHDHFIGYNASTPKTMADVLDGLAATLAEHGHSAPFTALVSRADIALFNALANWVTIVDAGIQVIDRGSATTGSQYFARGSRDLGRIGFYQSAVGLVELIASNRIPTVYVGMTKSYGNNDPRNALAVRVHPERGFGLAVIPRVGTDPKYPIEQVDVDFEFGVGVGQDRTNGAVGYLIAGGSYTDATIS